jgi:hypothetical protein
MTKRACAFCADTANITGEHVWSDWISTALGPRRFTITRKEKDGQIKKWHPYELNQKARVVCNSCNSGWMSDLENAVKPVIQNMILHCRETILQPSEIAILAAYAFKCTVIADHMHDNRPPFFTSTERRIFARTLTIPIGVQMWLSSMAVQKGLFKCGYITTPIGVSRGFEINHFTWGAGHLAFQVVTTRWKKKAFRRHESPPVLTQSHNWDAASAQFWPSSGKSVTWPLSMHLGDEVIDSFVQRWTNLVQKT